MKRPYWLYYFKLEIALAATQNHSVHFISFSNGSTHLSPMHLFSTPWKHQKTVRLKSFSNIELFFKDYFSRRCQDLKTAPRFGERLFYSLGRVKTYLRSTSRNLHLNNSLVLHKNNTDSLDLTVFFDKYFWLILDFLLFFCNFDNFGQKVLLN